MKTASNGVRSVSLPVSSLICPRSVSGDGLKIISPRPMTTNAVVPPPTVAANADPWGIERSRSSAVMWRLVTLNWRVGSRESRNSPSTDDTVEMRVTFGSLSAGPSRSISHVTSRAVMPASTSASTRTRSPRAGRRAVPFEHRDLRRRRRHPAVLERREAVGIRVWCGQGRQRARRARFDDALNSFDDRTDPIGWLGGRLRGGAAESRE